MESSKLQIDNKGYTIKYTKELQLNSILVLFYGTSVIILAQLAKVRVGLCVFGGNVGFVDQNCTIFSRIFGLMFLINAIKPNAEEKFQHFFYTTVQGSAVGSVQNNTSLNTIQKKRETDKT